MRIVTWNMGCGSSRGGYRKHHDEAWDYLVEKLRPDVALVQEATLSKLEAIRVETKAEVVIAEHSEDVDAGAAVVVFGGEVAVAPNVAISADTYSATVAVPTPAGTLTLAVIHVFPGKNLHPDLTRIAEVLGKVPAEQVVLLGGDFNAARRFDEVYGGKKNSAFFAAMEANGLHDIYFGLHGREGHSFWGRQAKEKYQDDHFFISKAWASKVRSCEIVDDEVVRRVSDHGPVVLELATAP